MSMPVPVSCLCLCGFVNLEMHVARIRSILIHRRCDLLCTVAVVAVTEGLLLLRLMLLRHAWALTVGRRR